MRSTWEIVLSYLAFAAMAAFILMSLGMFVLVATLVFCFLVNDPRGLENSVLLTIISIGLATAAFPWTLSGKWTAFFRRGSQLSGVLMLYGALIAAATLGVNYIENVTVHLEPENELQARPLFKVASNFGLLVGGLTWLIGFGYFAVLTILASYLFFEQETPDEDAD